MPSKFNNYFQVLVSCPTQRLTGTHSPLNEWYGAAQIHRADTVGFELQPGDEIHELVGGTFAIRGDVVVELSSKNVKPLLAGWYDDEVIELIPAEYRTVINQYRK